MAADRRRKTAENRGKRRSKGRASRGRTPFVITIVIFILAAVLTAGIILFSRFRTFSGYRVDAALEMSNSEESTSYYPYQNGYLKCAGDGVTYFTQKGVVWSENYSMVQPVLDICGEYVAVADMTQRNVYLYDKSGYINRFNLSHNITGIEVSRAGVIAVASSEGNINYIELRDRRGNEIMTEKNLFSSSGYLMDISLSEDGSKLAAVFVMIQKGTLKSRVVFYDLSGNGESSEIIVGTFDQYDSVLLTDVQFMEKDMVAVVGDTAFSVYQFRDGVELAYEEMGFPWEIQSLFFRDRYIGMPVEETEAETRYGIKVFDTAGNCRLDMGVDFTYERADFAGDNVILYSYNDCVMYSFDKIQKLYCSFDKHIEALKSADGVHFVYGTNADTEFITLK